MTTSVSPDKTKAVCWSYPTSPNAKKFGFYSTGCWTVSHEWRGDLNQPPKSLKGFATKAEAIEFARTLDLEWSPIYLRWNPADI